MKQEVAGTGSVQSRATDSQLLIFPCEKLIVNRHSVLVNERSLAVLKLILLVGHPVIILNGDVEKRVLEHCDCNIVGGHISRFLRFYL